MAIDLTQRRRDRFRGEQYNERPCQDCGDDCNNYDPPLRRIRCPNCKLLVCPWCFGHTHNIPGIPK